MLIPWLLVVSGAIFLLENLGVIPLIKWSIVWPIIMILAGVMMLKKKSGDGCCDWMKKKEDKHQVVCDYIAGMTDRYALDEYKKFFEPYERV